jgi:hypothetical protein
MIAKNINTMRTLDDDDDDEVNDNVEGEACVIVLLVLVKAQRYEGIALI